MKVLSVFSGGLDSMLASALIRAQGIEVQALFFETPFFSSPTAIKSAQTINLPIKVMDITERHLEMVKKPIHGYGENMNPCIDCHTMMLRTAGEMLQEEKASFIISGEVLGQRPMSQNRKALSLIAHESGFEGLILRPLSARHLPSTIPEKQGWVNRDELMDFSGRSRKPQMELAKKFKIENYPSPAGGCLLTDVVFSRRLKDLLSCGPNIERREIELLRLGRHFRLGPNEKLIVGRNKKENQAISSLSKEGDLLFTTVSVPGPTALAMGNLSSESEEFATAIVVSYSDADDNEMAEVRLITKGKDKLLKAKGLDKNEFKKYMI